LAKQTKKVFFWLDFFNYSTKMAIFWLNKKIMIELWLNKKRPNFGQIKIGY
jgi:hypothetical protein